MDFKQGKTMNKNKIDLTIYSYKELYLIVSNTYKYYKLRNNIKLLELLINDFKYTNKQITYLIDNIKSI